WVGSDQSPYLARIIAAEQEDLLQGDIPMFTTRPGSHDLFTANGERIVDFFQESGMDLVRRRVQQLGERDLQQQTWLIRASLATVARPKTGVKLPSFKMPEPRGEADRQRLLDAARAVADRLEQRALCGDDDASWLSLALAGESRWAMVTTGIDLYQG